MQDCKFMISLALLPHTKTEQMVVVKRSYTVNYSKEKSVCLLTAAIAVVGSTGWVLWHWIGPVN